MSDNQTNNNQSGTRDNNQTRKMKYQVAILFAFVFVGSQAAPPSGSSKVFNYQGFIPIKDDKTGEVIKQEGLSGEGETSSESSEAACWRLINEQSVVTFGQQRKVLDEFEEELKGLQLEPKLSEFITKTTGSLRINMARAEEALGDDSAEGFFDALFSTSEDIISLSSIVREPNLPDGTFLVFVKSISRLGRNNAELIQDFAEMCAFGRQTSSLPK